MVAATEVIQPEFTGTKKAQKLASKAFDVMRGRGMFMSDYAAIKLPLDAVAAHVAEQEGAKATEVSHAIAENTIVFLVETVDEVTYISTTRTGRAPVSNVRESTHSLAARFLTPEPKPERPARPVVERPRVDPSWATFSVPDYGDDDEDDYLDQVVDADIDIVVLGDTVTADAVESLDTVDAVEAVEAEPVEVEAEVATEAPVEEIPVEVVAKAPVKAAPASIATDFSGTDDSGLAAAIDAQLGTDARVANFAGKWMAEDRVMRLGRNDIRRIKDYISEQEQPLTDAVLAQDILNVRPNSPEFEPMQFAVNYRLSKEHREFDFVGTNDQRFWSIASLPQIGTTRRKPNEIGTDYRFLVDEAPAEVAHRSVKSVSRVLSFYEYTLGLLPYDLEMQQLLPAQVVPDQRSAVLTFEIPQLYTTYLVELRFPTPNRGGFLLGLDDFYAESLVPGAVMSITATDNDGHYTVEYLPATNQSSRLLDLDDRRSPRYHFRPTSYACEVDQNWLVSEDRFPKLGSEKPLDDKIRRRLDAVVHATFERVGLDDGSSFVTSFPELLAAANIERPVSETLLRSTIESDSKVTIDGDTLTYDAG